MTCTIYILAPDKAYAIMFLLANTGIRVGEIKYVTVESITQKGTWIKNKGRFRYVCFSNKLCEELYLYCTKKGIHEGPIFLGRNKTTPMSEKGIWAMLKRLAREANIDDQLIYPHSFRHFFAKLYLKESGNIADLADILGHNNIETTRIYTRTSIEEKRQIMEKIVID